MLRDDTIRCATLRPSSPAAYADPGDPRLEDRIRALEEKFARRPQYSGGYAPAAGYSSTTTYFSAPSTYSYVPTYSYGTPTYFFSGGRYYHGGYRGGRR